jgi:hypothetical protein
MAATFHPRDDTFMRDNPNILDFRRGDPLECPPSACRCALELATTRKFFPEQEFLSDIPQEHERGWGAGPGTLAGMEIDLSGYARRVILCISYVEWKRFHGLRLAGSWRGVRRVRSHFH